MALLVLVQSTDVSIVNASNTFLELTGWSREFLGAHKFKREHIICIRKPKWFQL